MSKSFSKRELDAIDLGWDSECAKPFEIDLAALDAGWDLPVPRLSSTYVQPFAREASFVKPRLPAPMVVCIENIGAELFEGPERPMIGYED